MSAGKNCAARSARTVISRVASPGDSLEPHRRPRELGLFRKRRVRAAIEEQRWLGDLRAMQHDNAANDDPVIAAFMDRVHPASDGCRRSFQPRSTFPRDERKRRRRSGRPRASEIGRNIPLTSGKDVDRKARRTVNQLPGLRVFPDTEEEEERVERQRGKGVGRHRVNGAIHLERDDGHARGVIACCLPERARVDRMTVRTHTAGTHAAPLRAARAFTGNTARAERTNSRTVRKVLSFLQAMRTSRRAFGSASGTTATPLAR